MLDKKIQRRVALEGGLDMIPVGDKSLTFRLEGSGTSHLPPVQCKGCNGYIPVEEINWRFLKQRVGINSECSRCGYPHLSWEG